MPGGHDTTIEVSNIMSFVLYTQILKKSVLKPASPGITLNILTLIYEIKFYDSVTYGEGRSCSFFFSKDVLNMGYIQST